MKWKCTKENAKRVIKRFLFAPKIIKGEGRWLEFATIEQKYTIGKWVDICFVD